MVENPAPDAKTADKFHNQTLLEQLKQMTKVVADTGDFNSLEKFRPVEATTNPSLVQAAATMPAYQELIDGTIEWSKKQGVGKSARETAAVALDHLTVEFGLRILKIVPGRVSTEVDARLSYDTEKTIAKGRSLIEKYESAGQKDAKKRVLIKMAATWESIRAAEILEREGIHCNLTLLFGIHQAVACAEANVALISPFVGRILDWHLKHEGKSSYAPAEDPGVRSVTEIYNYYKRFGYRTEVMGASFRNIGEITELAGCDLLTISPKLLKELDETKAELPRKLDPEKAKSMSIERIAVDEARFRAMHEKDQMAKDKLAQGIEDFSKAVVAVEELIAKKLG